MVGKVRADDEPLAPSLMQPTSHHDQGPARLSGDITRYHRVELDAAESVLLLTLRPTATPEQRWPAAEIACYETLPSR